MIHIVFSYLSKKIHNFFRVNDEKLSQLDILEDYPKLYGRRLEKIEVEQEDVRKERTQLETVEAK